MSEQVEDHGQGEALPSQSEGPVVRGTSVGAGQGEREGHLVSGPGISSSRKPWAESPSLSDSCCHLRAVGGGGCVVLPACHVQVSPKGWPACLLSLAPGQPRPPSSTSPQKKQSRGRRRRRPLRSVRWSSSSGDSSSGDSGGEGGGSSSSSSDSEDSEPEEAPEARAGGQTLPSAPHAVPDMDLWVPARQSTGEPCGGGAQGWPGRRAASPSPPRGSSEAQDGGRAAHPTASAPTEEVGQADTSSRIHSTSARGVGHPDSADTRLSSSEEPADKVGHRPRCTPHCCPGVTRAGAETQQAGLSSRRQRSWVQQSRYLSWLDRVFVSGLSGQSHPEQQPLFRLWFALKPCRRAAEGTVGWALGLGAVSDPSVPKWGRGRG